MALAAITAWPNTSRLCKGEDSLEALFQDFRSYGLPMPHENSQLAILQPSGVCIINGVRHFKQHLVLLVPSGATTTRAVYLVGLQELPATQGDQLKVVEPSADVLAQTTRFEATQWWNARFPTNPDLVLAVQCHALGWKELARALLKRFHTIPLEDRFSRPLKRPPNDRAALAEVAWNHHCNEFARAMDGRQAIKERMKVLLNGPHHLSTKARRVLIEDMEQTLNRRPTEPGSLEAELDAILELEVAEVRPECGDNRSPDRNPHFQRLKEQGLDAVPMLMQHLNDFRLTRCIDQTNQGDYTWHVRIADVASRLLDGLATEPFAYDFRKSEGRGKSLDEAHVRYWYKQTVVATDRSAIPNAKKGGQR